uniref:tRNA-queuosine alpha-mannosyltransferase n=1 Tax=Drosophila pseudoobscura pseudoobscura TaxID=46245 RepID=B5DS82_DROPS
MSSVKPQILIIEPFYGGSHKQLIDTLIDSLNLTDYELFSLPATKWHWRARTSALYFSQLIPPEHNYKVLNDKDLPIPSSCLTSKSEQECLHLIWPHRWEHDKNPTLLVEVLLELNKRQVNFKVTICGEKFPKVPEAFEGIQEKLGAKLVNYGRLSREKYIETLLTGDIVISTADHEFYGVSMLEATYCGCYPIAPNKLVYPEIYPKVNLYNTPNSLIKMLYNWCRYPGPFRRNRDKFFQSFSFDQYSAKHLVPRYLDKMGT